jgi:hypothetical protein
MFSTVILPECGRFLPGDGRFTEAFALATDPGYGHPGYAQPGYRQYVGLDVSLS